jgi:hypothetical protein
MKSKRKERKKERKKGKREKITMEDAGVLPKQSTNKNEIILLRNSKRTIDRYLKVSDLICITPSFNGEMGVLFPESPEKTLETLTEDAIADG